MRDAPLSTCEKDFILKSISQQRRLDGRKTYDYRNVSISFGMSPGCCHVQLGNTRVLAQVSCQVGQPKATRPNEGVLFVNVELSSMASPAFDVGRQTDESVELSRLMERCLKESQCLDLESLCIVAGEKVWHLRADIHVLNHEGNILDCASIAAISALSHFRRPDVTVKGEEITIHSMEERNPVALSIHHMPLLVSFAFFLQGQYMLIDPSEKEEKVTEGKMVIGINKHREICTLQVTGQMLMMKDQVLRCSNIAAMKVTQMTNLIQEALQIDTETRFRGQKNGFAELISKDNISANHKGETEIILSSSEEYSSAMDDDSEDGERSRGKYSDKEKDINKEFDPSVEIWAKGVASIGNGGTGSWLNVAQPKRNDFETSLKDQASIKGQEVAKRPHPGSDGEDSEEEGQIIV